MKKEIKSQQFNAKVKPSVYLQAKKVAYMRHEKISGMLEKWLEQYVADHQYDLDRYILTFGTD